MTHALVSLMPFAVPFAPSRHRVAMPRTGTKFGLRDGPLTSIVSGMALFKARRSSDGSEGGPAPMGSELTDSDLCQALSGGEAWAAEVIYDRVEDVVDAVLFRLLGPGDGERDDLAQQALERVISTIVSGRFSRGCSLRSWATLITQHLAIDAMRARSRERKLFDRSVGHQALELVAEDTRTPERAAETHRRVERLLSALSTVRSDATAPRPSCCTTSWATISRRSRASRA